MAGKVRLMIVLSREDDDAPRALSVCAPITRANRGSEYEVELPRLHFLREKSFVNTQGMQAIQHHELSRKPIGVLSGPALEKVYDAARYLFDI